MLLNAGKAANYTAVVAKRLREEFDSRFKSNSISSSKPLLSAHILAFREM